MSIVDRGEGRRTPNYRSHERNDLYLCFRKHPKPLIKRSKICKISPVHFSDMVFLGLMNHCFSLGGRIVVIKKKSEDFEKTN